MTGAGPGAEPGAEPGPAMARLLLEAKAVQVSTGRPFVLTAGWASPVYVDCRRLIGEPRLRRAATELMLATLAQHRGTPAPFDAIAGGETAGMLWAAWIADGLDLTLRYVRKRPLGIGRNAQVEGGSVEGSRVLLVDDLATDAGSKVAFARGLRAAGAELRDILVLFHNRVFPGWEQRLAQRGLSLLAVASWDDMLPLLDAAERRFIEAFLADPTGWSAAHGGRQVIAALSE